MQRYNYTSNKGKKGHYYRILGLCRDHGKENGNYYIIWGLGFRFAHGRVYVYVYIYIYINRVGSQAMAALCVRVTDGSFPLIGPRTR